jgi:hypothetical protein
LIKNHLIDLKTHYFNFRIREHSINDFSVKYDSENIENCAQGMKYLLVILKSYLNAALKSEDEIYKQIIDKSFIINNK